MQLETALDAFAMASTQQGRVARARPNTTKLHGEGASNSKARAMANTAKDHFITLKDKNSPERWLFTKEQLQNTPSRRDNVTAEKELNYRQQAANLIQDMGQRLPVNQLTINSAIVYMHRFYMFHSFQAFSRFVMAPTALFLAAKVEEQPRKLEHVIKVCHACLHPDKPHLDVHSDAYLKQVQELVQNELILLETLGFDISIDHPHTHVVKCTQLVKASRDLSQMAYFMATNSLHLTTFCLTYKPTVVSAMCIHLSCKWSNYEIPLSSTGKAYWTYMDPSITEALLEDIINEFLQILNLCPTRLRKLKNYKPSQRDGGGGHTPASEDGQQPSTSKVSSSHSSSKSTTSVPSSHPQHSNQPSQSELQKKHPSMTYAEYINKREKEQQSKPHPSAKEMDDKAKQHKAGHPNQRHPNQRPHSKPGQPHPGRPHHKVPPPQGSHPRPPSNQGASSSQNHHMKQGRPTQKPPGAADHHKRPDKMHPNMKQQSNPSGIPGLHKPRPKEGQPPSQPPRPSASNTEPSANRNKEDDTVVKSMEQKLMEQMKAEKTIPAPSRGSEALPSQDGRHSSSQTFHSKSTSKDQRQSLPGHSNLQQHGNPPPPPNEPKSSLYEQYKKNPDALRHQLKKKAQNEPLTEEERVLWGKIKRKEEEMRRRKKEHKKHKSHHAPPADGSSVPQEGAGAPSPGGGPLTVRIKLPASVRAEMSKGGTTGSTPGSKVAASSSGSGSEPQGPSPGGLVKSRKRAHGHDTSGQSDPISAKQSRKSEGHHHQGSHHGSHESSRSKSRHHHHSKSHQSGQKIDEALFQRALEDAVTMVQSAHGGTSSEKGAPTATVKQASAQNGEQHHSSKHDSKHRSSSKRSKFGFDPAAPISSTLPEDLFEMEDEVTDNHKQGQNADLSSPETGEIRDDDDYQTSPFRDQVSSRPGASSKDHGGMHWRGNNNNNNQSSHYHQASNGSMPPPPLTHGSRSGMHYPGDQYERLPPPPPLASKPR